MGCKERERRAKGMMNPVKMLLSDEWSTVSDATEISNRIKSGVSH